MNRSLLLFVVIGLTRSMLPLDAQQGSDRRRPTPPPGFEFLFTESIPPGGLRAAWARLPFDTIALERTPCLGRCPAYRLTFHRGQPNSSKGEVFADRYGRAELSVTRVAREDTYTRLFPPAIGEFTGWVDIWTFGRLSLLIQRANLAVMPDGRRTVGSDADMAFLSVTGQLKKTVLVGDATQIDLWAIQEAIDSAAKSVVWKPK